MLKTIPNINVREEPEVPAPAEPVVTIATPKSKVDRHEEMRRKGEEKRRLLARLLPESKSEEVTESTQTIAPVTPKLSRFAPGELNPNKKKNKRKLVGLFEEEKGLDSRIQTSLDSSKPLLNSIHTDDKRKKMRLREKAKRDKLREKKAAKAAKVSKPIDKTKPKYNEVMKRPSEAIREMGLKLAKKFSKESSSFKSAYDTISKSVPKTE